MSDGDNEKTSGTSLPQENPLTKRSLTSLCELCEDCSPALWQTSVCGRAAPVDDIGRYPRCVTSAP